MSDKARTAKSGNCLKCTILCMYMSPLICWVGCACKGLNIFKPLFNNFWSYILMDYVKDVLVDSKTLDDSCRTCGWPDDHMMMCRNKSSIRCRATWEWVDQLSIYHPILRKHNSLSLWSMVGSQPQTQTVRSAAVGGSCGGPAPNTLPLARGIWCWWGSSWPNEIHYFPSYSERTIERAIAFRMCLSAWTVKSAL